MKFYTILQNTIFIENKFIVMKFLVRSVLSLFIVNINCTQEKFIEFNSRILTWLICLFLNIFNYHIFMIIYLNKCKYCLNRQNSRATVGNCGIINDWRYAFASETNKGPTSYLQKGNHPTYSTAKLLLVRTTMFQS